MSKVISIASWKGGVGKTTTAVNISAYIQMQGKKVLAVDLDPQHSLSKHFGIHPGQLKGQPTIYDALYAAINLNDESTIKSIVQNAICHSTTADVLPSTPKLSSLETLLSTATCREQLLNDVLSPIKENYDFIIIDCHPGADLLTINALTASDSVILPVEAHILSSDGLDQVHTMIRTVQRRLNPKLQIEGVLITKFQESTNCCRQVMELIRRNYGDQIHIYDEQIKYAIKVAEAPAFGVSIHEYAPNSPVSTAYGHIASEVIDNG